jgi:putative SbcD/Mre11-related phosphoesterase
MYQFESWQLTPEGAVIHSGQRTAVIADVHLGYEWARGAAGDCVPAHTLSETLAGLSRVLARAEIDCLVVAGDLIESPRPCRQAAADLRRLQDWLEARGVVLLLLEGNHERHHGRGRPLPSTCSVAGWTIEHGHLPLTGERTISGHVHPVVRFEGITARCFLVGADRIVLPAFSSNAAGCDVATACVPAQWLSGSPLRCVVSTGEDLLDFGLLADLRCRHR